MGYNFKNSWNKYGAKKVSYKGYTFDSTNEMSRFMYLEYQQKRGDISGLRLQTPFMLISKTVKTIEIQKKTKIKYEERVVEMASLYHNDFTYRQKDGTYVCEEFKSEMTAKLPDYILRRKLMVKKIYEHNKKGRSRWIFREVVYSKGKTTITDK